MYTIATHNGGFHSDDVFSIAAFQLLLGVDEVSVVRTRDEELIAQADYVVDVGGIYDHAAKRYDHHQVGAPVRENGIPYAGFGLVWRHYGEEICGSAEVASSIEERLCQPIDAGDNGVELYSLNETQVRPFELYNVITSFRPTTNDVEEVNTAFMRAVAFARELLVRLIAQDKEYQRVAEVVRAVYEQSEDKTILLFSEPIERHMLIQYPEPLAIIYPSDEGTWKVGTVPTGEGAFEDRGKFPAAWAGLRDEELQVVSGIEDALFCHKNSWRFVAGSKESAIKAARMVG